MMVKNDPPNKELFRLDPNVHFLIRLRLVLRWDRNRLAELLGVSYDAIWQWETRRRSPSFTWEQIIILEGIFKDAGIKFSDFPPNAGPTQKP